MRRVMRISGNYRWKSEVVEADVRVLSLGAGVQSTTLLLMALEGDFDRPDYAIFADTGWEPQAVYDHLDWLIDYAEARDFQIHIATAGNIRDDVIGGTDGIRFASMPLFTETGADRAEGRLRRQCTREYKIAPIVKKIRELAGLQPRQRMNLVVETWQGISTDEMQRMKESHYAWEWRRYPLVELEMSRHDCERWLRNHGFVVPEKSACVGCPYRNDHEWRRLRETEPEAWVSAVEFDHKVREGLRGVDSRHVYLHRQMVPLDEVNLMTAEEAGQQNLFLEECDGVCGL